MLVKHGINNVDEGLIAGEKSVTPGKQVTFEPALAHMLAQHLHNPSFTAEMFVHRQDLLHPLLVSRLVKGFQPIRGGFVGTKHAKIPGVQVKLHYITEKSAQYPRG